MAPEQVLGVRCDPRSRHLCARARYSTSSRPAALPFGNRSTGRRAAPAALSRPVPPRVLVPATPAVAAGDHPALPRDRRARALRRLQRRSRFDLGEPGRGRAHRARRSRMRRGRLVERSRSAGCGDAQFEPAPCPPPSTATGRCTDRRGGALAPQPRDEPRCREALREAARRLIAADGRCRIACVTVVPPAATLSGERRREYGDGAPHPAASSSCVGWASPLRAARRAHNLPRARVGKAGCAR